MHFKSMNSVNTRQDRAEIYRRLLLTTILCSEQLEICYGS
ncbi:hypothetical protein V6Z11_D03G194600 [Gossypium hirsutum]